MPHPARPRENRLFVVSRRKKARCAGLGDIQIINLPWQNALKSAGASKVVADGAYRLRSDQPVAVYQYSPLEYQIGNTSSYTNTHNHTNSNEKTQHHRQDFFR